MPEAGEIRDLEGEMTAKDILIKWGYRIMATVAFMVEKDVRYRGNNGRRNLFSTRRD